MKTIFRRMVLLLVLLGPTIGWTQQNLVPNSSFEKYKYCPVGFVTTQLDLLPNWKQATRGTADYYNVCSKGTAGVPSNTFGWQMPADGEGYIGLITYAPSKRNSREYLQAKLAKPLSGGKRYCVSFYVSQSDHASYIADGLGIHFSKEPVSADDMGLLPLYEHVGNPAGHVLYHSKNWIKISNLVSTTGGEQYLTIGNFRADHDTQSEFRRLNRDTIRQVWEYAYYYIDNISVVEVASAADCECTVPEITKMLNDPGYPFDYVKMDRMQLDNVNFDFDKANINREAERKLKKAAKLMKKYTSYYLEVHGHTDVHGPEGYNNTLSKKRADAVFNFMVAEGIDPKRMRIKSHGESLLKVEGEDPESSAINRRVEFELLQL